MLKKEITSAYDFKSYRMLSEDNIILVYQMGKVGSNTIRWSLKKAGLKVSHIHSLYLNRGYEFYKNFLLSQVNYPATKKILYSFFYQWQRLKLRRRKKLKIITLVREPVSVNISSFFQNLSYFAYEYEHKAASSLYEAFFDKCNHDYVLDWFDKEFLPTTGLDIYQYDFDKDAGYSIIKEKKVECLVIKLEKLDELEGAIAEFVGVRDFKLVRHNVSAHKWFNPVYREFKRNVMFSLEFIERIYSSRLVQHFYSEDEINEFMDKYLKSG